MVNCWLIFIYISCVSFILCSATESSSDTPGSRVQNATPERLEMRVWKHSDGQTGCTDDGQEATAMKFKKISKRSKSSSSSAKEKRKRKNKTCKHCEDCEEDRKRRMVEEFETEQQSENFRLKRQVMKGGCQDGRCPRVGRSASRSNQRNNDEEYSDENERGRFNNRNNNDDDDDESEYSDEKPKPKPKKKKVKKPKVKTTKMQDLFTHFG